MSIRFLIAALLLASSNAVLAADGAARALEQRARQLELAKAVGANPERAYPPSCLSDPLPTTPRGPVVTQTANLGDWSSGYVESIVITAWRVACSGGKSAILVKFDRATAREGTFPAPDVPLPNVQRTGQADVFLNINSEPNTRRSEVSGNPLINDSVVVVERFPGLAFDLDPAFTLALDTYTLSQGFRIPLQMAGYNPATHPDGAQALEINGYLTGSWYDAAHAGEGIFLEVAEQANGARFVFFSWFTYGPTGQPFWIVGNATVAPGAQSIVIPALYFTNGGFAGDFGAQATANPWGDVSFAFANCNQMTLGFQSTHTDAGVPQGTGTRTWTRLSSVNGFVCS